MLMVALPVVMDVAPGWLLAAQLRRNNKVKATPTSTKIATGKENRDSLIADPRRSIEITPNKVLGNRWPLLPFSGPFVVASRENSFCMHRLMQPSEKGCSGK
jgi:hypothetical protein